MATLGPNTNAPPEILAPNCLLCAGEDRATLLAAMDEAGLRSASSHFSYRCYEFWKMDSIVVIWTGIGTGCLEPLLWEIFAPGIIDKIVLVGTAGKMPNSPVRDGQVYLVSEAWPAGTGLDAEAPAEPQRPQWPPPLGLPEASSVSTDFYYGFSPRIESKQYPFSSGRLRSAYEFHVKRGTALVEMEVAQFYAFCKSFPGGPSQFVAAKVCVNTVGIEQSQVPNSRRAIADAVGAACKLLQPSLAPSHLSTGERGQEESRRKL